MTGFGQSAGETEPGEEGGLWLWTCELKSVNARGLDIRWRAPGVLHWLEPVVRRMIARRVSRGSVSATITARREWNAPGANIDRPLLAALLDLHESLAREGRATAPPRLDALLAVKGVIRSPDSSGEEMDDRERTAITGGVERALEALCETRREEGERLEPVLARSLDAMAALVAKVDQCADHQVGLLRERVRQRTAELLDSLPQLGEERLAQEVALLASRADVREEIDRLRAHVASCRALLGDSDPVGRRLDFLCQELNREINTICSKSVDLTLTQLGLDLKSETERLREQVQNLE